LIEVQDFENLIENMNITFDKICPQFYTGVLMEQNLNEHELYDLSVLQSNKAADYYGKYLEQFN
jgi:hypothetical protein